MSSYVDVELPFGEGPGQARHSDPETSKTAAGLVTARASTARVRLLEAFALDWYSGRLGMTDEQAAAKAGLSPRSEYATRCSELRRSGVLEPTGETRQGQAGTPRIVSIITESGLDILRQRRTHRASA